MDMPGSTDPHWANMTHAYGSAGNMPALLERARLDLRGSHERESVWLDLWSALCHQGDAYVASYAAIPHLVSIAESRRGSAAQFDPLHLIGCIELARLEGRGPALEPSVEGSYQAGLAHARKLVDEALERQWPSDFRQGLLASQAALSGRSGEARAILDAEP